MEKLFGRIVLITGMTAFATAALAAAPPPAPFGPAAAGATVNYRVNGSNDGENGPQSFYQTVIVNRAADGTLAVLSGTTALGSVTPAGVAVPGKAPANLALFFNPFKHLAELYANRPADVAPGASWKATAVVPFGSRTFSVPVNVTAAVDGDSIKLTAQGTDNEEAQTEYGDTTFAVSVDESANYEKGLFTGSTFSVQTAMKTQLKKHQGERDSSYSTRYYVAPAS